ncbi:hypothetical protein JK185_15195 [Gluconobacter wancherniae]|uniref:hypothetical protein n=1 Tax=Gluconobacter wancherniae TaxID=1307955 RepID=UPI001B8C80FF|nr:hypothetical protein [Gluconobacter wancherniae]MBS1064327.1 hypothetical protein [Gluconobacter wancherniae]
MLSRMTGSESVSSNLIPGPLAACFVGLHKTVVDILSMAPDESPAKISLPDDSRSIAEGTRLIAAAHVMQVAQVCLLTNSNVTCTNKETERS